MEICHVHKLCHIFTSAIAGLSVCKVLLIIHLVFALLHTLMIYYGKLVKFKIFYCFHLRRPSSLYHEIGKPRLHEMLVVSAPRILS